MSVDRLDLAGERVPAATSGRRAFWLTEDWWAIGLGLGLVVVGYGLFASGASLKWIAVTPEKWTGLDQIGAHFAANWLRYLAQFVLWLVLFAAALTTLGYRLRDFAASFVLLYLLSVFVFALGQWSQANAYNLEPPLVALLLGLAISNLVGLPKWMDASFRVEFYVKTGIVLLGATLPFALVLWAGPVAILQASIVSIATFLVIFATARRLGVDRRLAATLGAGGAVCGVSASIAIAGAVGARKGDAPIAITVVIAWAIVMIFFLPFAARWLELPTGVAGAWIGTSEFADAAGFAAAQTYGGFAGRVPEIAGTADQAVWSFTLMKVVGRDVWIGVWALALAIVATTRWEPTGSDARPDAGEIWRRFPKFVLGFILASLFVSWAARNYSLAEYNKIATPGFVGPIKDLRTWAFIFCFLSIGLTTRVRDLAKAGARPFAAFSVGVVVNVALGLLLSAWLFAGHWASLAR
jgi:uncharacterized integral membrane protein (TIGR00698 family)